MAQIKYVRFSDFHYDHTCRLEICFMQENAKGDAMSFKQKIWELEWDHTGIFAYSFDPVFGDGLDPDYYWQSDPSCYELADLFMSFHEILLHGKPRYFGEPLLPELRIYGFRVERESAGFSFMKCFV